MIKGGLLFVWLFIFCSTAHGANFLFAPWSSEPLAFSFSGLLETRDLESNQGEVKQADIYGLRSELMEFSLSWMTLGLAGTHYWVDGFGEETSRFYRIEFSDTVSTPRWMRMRLASRASFHYNRFSGNDRPFYLDKYGAEINLVAMFYLFDSINLYSGGGFSESASKWKRIVSDNIAYDGPIGNFYHAGIDILLGQGGHVGVEGRYKDYLSIEVFFQRRY